MRLLLALSTSSLLALGGCSAAATCVVGATQSCVCPGGASGAQTCVAGGMFGACDCGAGIDAGVPLDAPGLDAAAADDAGGTDAGLCPSGLALCGARCVDTTTDEENCGGCADATHTCASGSFCVGGSCVPIATCPPPFVQCGADCIDPSSNRAHCGASGDCAGANAGAACGGVCDGGECVFESCADVLTRGASTGDGLYLVDVDGTGPLGPANVYCDMTTDGGGWTLVYRIRNDIPDIADPWWPMVGLGAGTALPAAPMPLPAGTHFDGPTRDVRAAFASRIGGSGAAVDVRVTMLESTGMVRYDVRSPSMDRLGFPALGRSGSPATGCGSATPSPFSEVLVAPVSSSFVAGEHFYDCFNSPGVGPDNFVISDGSGGVMPPLCGDESAGPNTTTLFWIRTLTP